jgi:hypothetical protein
MVRVYCEDGAFIPKLRELQSKGRITLVKFPYDTEGTKKPHEIAEPSAAYPEDLHLHPEKMAQLRPNTFSTRCVAIATPVNMPQPRIPCTEPHGFDPFERSEPAVPSENTIRRGSSGSTLVPMGQSPDLGERDDLSGISVVDRPWIGRILLER